MPSPLLLRLLACAALVLLGCGRLGYELHALSDDDAGPSPHDAGPTPDAGPDADPTDAGPDAPLPPPPDAAPPADAAPTCPAGPTGCPRGVAFVDPVATLQVGGTGGVGFAETCPGGQVLMGFDGGTVAGLGSVGRIRATCGTVTFTPATLAVTIAPTTLMPFHGSDNATSWTALCPDDHIVVGFRGRSDLLVDRLIFRCAPLVISGGPGSYTVGLGPVITLPAVGGSGGSAFPDQTCAGGRVGTAWFGRAGQALDAFGVRCSLPTLTF